MSKHVPLFDIDQKVLHRIRTHIERPIVSDLDYIERATFANNAWTTIENREQHKFDTVEKLEAKVKSLSEASEAIKSDSKDYELLAKIHFYTSELEKAKRIAEPFEDMLDEILDLMSDLEFMAKRDLGYVPHSFIEEG